jgi:hypothetical protein
VTPFEIFTLRFGRHVAGTRVVADLTLERAPLYAGADWDATRDARSRPQDDLPCVTMIAAVRMRLDLFVRFLGFPAVQNYRIWAADTQAGAPLPTVEPLQLFDPLPGCVTGEVQFSVPFTADSVGRFVVHWQWFAQYLNPKTKQPEGHPAHIGETRFELFVILGTPVHPPWTQDLVANPDGTLPRRKALQLACAMASGTATLFTAAGSIAEGIFGLGMPGHGGRRISYGHEDEFICDADHHVFHLARFLDFLDGPASAPPVAVACGDVAAAVCALANVLGANLRRGMLLTPAGRLALPRINLVGAGVSAPANWVNHVIAIEMLAAAPVFDGCLQLDMDPGPHDDWQTPKGLPFGDADESPETSGYRHLLLRNEASKCHLVPMADLVLDRPATRPPSRGPIGELFQRFKDDFLAVAGSLRSLPGELSFRGLLLPDGWIALAGEFEDRIRTAAAAWEQGPSGKPRQVSIRGELAPSTGAAIEVAAWRLTFDHWEMPVRVDTRFPGAIVAVSADEQHLMLVYANGVLRVRSEGPDPVAVTTLFAPLLSALPS